MKSVIKIDGPWVIKNESKVSIVGSSSQLILWFNFFQDKGNSSPSPVKDNSILIRVTILL